MREQSAASAFQSTNSHVPQRHCLYLLPIGKPNSKVHHVQEVKEVAVPSHFSNVPSGTRRCTTVTTVRNSDDQAFSLRWAHTPICNLCATAASTASTASAHQEHQRIRSIIGSEASAASTHQQHQGISSISASASSRAAHQQQQQRISSISASSH